MRKKGLSYELTWWSEQKSCEGSTTSPMGKGSNQSSYQNSDTILRSEL